MDLLYPPDLGLVGVVCRPDERDWDFGEILLSGAVLGSSVSLRDTMLRGGIGGDAPWLEVGVARVVLLVLRRGSVPLGCLLVAVVAGVKLDKLLCFLRWPLATCLSWAQLLGLVTGTRGWFSSANTSSAWLLACVYTDRFTSLRGPGLTFEPVVIVTHLAEGVWLGVEFDTTLVMVLVLSPKESAFTLFSKYSRVCRQLFNRSISSPSSFSRDDVEWLVSLFSSPTNWR